MNQPVDSGESHGGIGEDPAPFAERLVRGDEQRAALVASADQLEQHRGLSLILGDVGDVIEDQQIEALEAVVPASSSHKGTSRSLERPAVAEGAAAGMAVPAVQAALGAMAMAAISAAPAATGPTAATEARAAPGCCSAAARSPTPVRSSAAAAAVAAAVGMAVMAAMVANRSGPTRLT